jgi:peptide/nickel transport system substrate-binding protein
MQGIESMKVDGDYGGHVTLATGNADLPFLMADYHLMIQPGGGWTIRPRASARALQGEGRTSPACAMCSSAPELLGRSNRGHADRSRFL